MEAGNPRQGKIQICWLYSLSLRFFSSLQFCLNKDLLCFHLSVTVFSDAESGNRSTYSNLVASVGHCFWLWFVGFVCLVFFFIIIIIISMSNLNCVLIRHFFQYEIHDVTDFVFLQESWGKKMKHTFKKCQATPSLMLPVYHYYCPALALSAT